MVPSLLELLEPGTLLIWDRGFFSYDLIPAVCERGAHLLARVKSNTVLTPLQHLVDGSLGRGLGLILKQDGSAAAREEILRETEGTIVHC